MLDTQEAGVYLTPTVRSMLHVEIGAYLDMRHPVQGTCITRRLRDLNLEEPLPDVYILMDLCSVHYLCAQPYDQLEIKRSLLDFDVP